MTADAGTAPRPGQRESADWSRLSPMSQIRPGETVTGPNDDPGAPPLRYGSLSGAPFNVTLPPEQQAISSPPIATTRFTNGPVLRHPSRTW